MIAVLFSKIKQFIREPWTFIIFTGMSVLFAFIFGGSSMGTTTLPVPVYSDEDTMRTSAIGKALGEEAAFEFNWMSEEEVNEQVSAGKAEVGVILHENDFQVIVGVDSPNVGLIRQTIQKVYLEDMRKDRILEASNTTSTEDKQAFLKDFDEAMGAPPFRLEAVSFRGEGSFVYDNSLHRLFGFSLFFVIYTIAYNVLSILLEKRDGIWDRIILSPVKKWEMYVGNLIYSFITGYIQVVIVFLIFRYVFGIDFYGRFLETLLLLIPYVFSIVSLAILITAIVKTVQQFNAVLPIISVSMAMIGGAYWPIEIVESDVLLALAKINPLTYGMEVLHGATVYGYSMNELLVPISILILSGVLMMGLGIHLMERRHI
ncbi:ABC transporter permease [Ornithinibacillus contaminans]|uniref:ABC transporter permease n=1 Tax=Ornithinibacillus contaminans TaxID=694055 RepID=UPI00064DDFC4|nr:ABC transporter permease [Ornithinibacillus contaminans]